MKHDGIDLLKLYAGADDVFGNEIIFSGVRDRGESSNAKADVSASARAFKAHEKWNAWLTTCLETNNMNELIRTRYRLQIGMDDLVKKNLNTPEISQMFVRWVASIERTARQIIKRQNPKPKDLDQKDFLRWKQYKKSIDTEFEKFLRKSSY